MTGGESVAVQSLYLKASGAQLSIRKNTFAYTFGPKIWEDSITILIGSLCYVYKTLMICRQLTQSE